MWARLRVWIAPVLVQAVGVLLETGKNEMRGGKYGGGLILARGLHTQVSGISHPHIHTHTHTHTHTHMHKKHQKAGHYGH